MMHNITKLFPAFILTFFVYVYIHTSTYIYIHTYTHMQVCTDIWNALVCAHVWALAVKTVILVCMHVCMCTRVHMWCTSNSDITSLQALAAKVAGPEGEGMAKSEQSAQSTVGCDAKVCMWYCSRRGTCVCTWYLLGHVHISTARAHIHALPVLQWRSRQRRRGLPVGAHTNYMVHIYRQIHNHLLMVGCMVECFLFSFRPCR